MYFIFFPTLAAVHLDDWINKVKVNTFVHISGFKVSVQAISSSEQRSPLCVPVGI